VMYSLSDGAGAPESVSTPVEDEVTIRLHDQFGGDLAVGSGGPLMGSVPVEAEVAVGLMDQSWVVNTSWVDLGEGPDWVGVAPGVEGLVDDDITITLNLESVHVVEGSDVAGSGLWSKSLTSMETIGAREKHVVWHLFELLSPVIWDIRDFDVVVDGMSELLKFLLASLGLSGWLPFLVDVFLKSLSLIVVEEIIEGLVEVLVPVG